MNSLKCAECGHENDSTRVFCHNCGIRLERPEGEKATIAEVTPVMGRSSEPVRRGDGAGATVGRVIRSLISLALLAAILAALIQAARTPDWVPAPMMPDKAKATQFYQSLQDFANTRYPRTIDLTQEQANTYLVSRIEPQGGGDGLLQVKFVRAFVTLERDRMRFAIEQEYLDWPVFPAIVLEPKVTANRATEHNEVGLRLVGAEIGRLRLPAFLAPFLQKHLQGVIDATASEAQFLSHAESLIFLPGAARFGWNGSQSPGD